MRKTVLLDVLLTMQNWSSLLKEDNVWKIPPEVAEIALQAQESDRAAELLEQELEKDKTQEGETVISMDPEGTGLQPDDDGDDDDDDENDDD